ncbi:MAG: 16S rRNA (adenine(1518)-N(6)/adenine(1519)-N(6))-dimethyltransferase RsmA [Cytophagales bacterium]
MKKSHRQEKGLVSPKKHLGQHFLNDLNIAKSIAGSLTNHQSFDRVIEVGPGVGVLSQFLMELYPENLFMIELDYESVVYLKNKYPSFSEKVVHADFLKEPIFKNDEEKVAIIGNFPYNISSQIFFKILENKNQVTEVVGMIQKEVAERLASPPGNKNYGILSVLLQTYYDIEYLFTVHEHVFTPPPKVKSAVIRVKRNEVKSLPVSDEHFKKIVKQAFSVRRKTLRNALKPLNLSFDKINSSTLEKRAEQLSVQDFIELALALE